MKWTPERYLKFALHTLFTMLPVIIFLAILNYRTSIHLWVMGVAVVFALLLFFRTFKQVFMLITGRMELELNDITDRNPILIEALQPYEQTLFELGFERNIQIEVQLPMMNKKTIEWEYLSNHTGTFASLVDLEMKRDSITAEFITFFPGPAMVSTIYPAGTNMREENWHHTAIADSLEAAYNYHMQQAANFREKFGEPQIDLSKHKRNNLRLTHFHEDQNISYNTILLMFGAFKLSVASLVIAIYFFLMTLPNNLGIINPANNASGLTISAIVFVLSLVIGFAISYQASGLKLNEGEKKKK